jgi:hypothetical protein
MLDSHPTISSYEELFLPAEAHQRTWGRADQEFFHEYYARHGRRRPLATTFWALRYLEKVYAPRPAAEAVGMKLMYSQLREYPWLLAYVVFRRVRVLHLVRTDLLDVVLSQETAKARSQYHALGSDQIDQRAVHLRTGELIPALEGLQRSVDRVRLLLRLLPAASIEISYEELTRGEAAFDPVLRFLGVAPRPLTSRFAKLNRGPKQALIANYDEVERALRGTRFERFLVG